jgi:hypothetical protein
LLSCSSEVCDRFGIVAVVANRGDSRPRAFSYLRMS